MQTRKNATSVLCQCFAEDRQTALECVLRIVSGSESGSLGLMDGPDSDLLDAFHQVVGLFPDWSAALPEFKVCLGGKPNSMSAVCIFASAISEPLPDEILQKLRSNMDADDRDLKEQIMRDQSYGSAAGCMLKLIARRKAYDERLEELRRDKGLIDP